MSDMTGEQHAVRLEDALVDVVKGLAPAIERLDRTPDFIAYAHRHGVGEDEQVALTRRTVPPALYARLFPEVRGWEDLVATMEGESDEDQAAFWAAALCDLTLGRESEAAGRLRALARTKYDVAAVLTSVGEAALPELVRVAEAYALSEGDNERDLASSAMLILCDLDDAPEEYVERLQALLRRVCEQERTQPRASGKGFLIARVLHALRPDRFPPEEFSRTTNHLLNAGAFGA